MNENRFDFSAIEKKKIAVLAGFFAIFSPIKVDGHERGTIYFRSHEQEKDEFFLP